MAQFVVNVVYLIVAALAAALAITGHFWLLGCIVLGALAHIGDQRWFQKK